MMEHSAEQYDYVIVGAGAAGCLLAHRLSGDGRTRVLVVEAGGSDRHLWVRIPAGFTRTVHDRRVNWCLETEPEAHCGERRIWYPRGKGLGGSSSINGHLFVRGNPFDFDTWAARGNEGWSYQDVLPAFKRIERRPAGDREYRGHDGELWVSDLRESHPLTQRFVDAAREIGIPFNPDYNGADQEGVGFAQQMMHRGRRFSAADAWLRPALKRGLVNVVTHATASRLLVEGDRVTGIEFQRAGRTFTVTPARETLLCAGAIHSPHLLQLSGICSASLAREIGVPLVHELPGVGEGLRDHYAARLVYRLRRQVSINHRTRGIRLGLEVLKYLFARRGVLAMSPAHGMLFARCREGQPRPDVQLVFAPGSYEGGKTGQAAMEREPGMTCGIWQLRNESTGWVRAQTGDPFSAPRIQPNYLDHPEDRDVMVNGIRLARRILQASAFDDIRGEEVLPGSAAESDEALLEHARLTGATVYHPIGTCAMGVDPMAVVDDQLRIHGLRNVRVIDASIMPTMVSGNSYAATLMIAERGAEILQRR